MDHNSENIPIEHADEPTDDSEVVSDALKHWLEVTRDQQPGDSESIHQFPWDHLAIDQAQPSESHSSVQVVARIGHSSASATALESVQSNQIIGLDQQIDSPVDLLVNDEVIAQGVLVVQDGLYAVQVTKIVNDVSESGSQADEGHPPKTKAS